MSEKKTQRITVWLPESLEIDLMRQAAAEDRKLSDFIGHVLAQFCYGHLRALGEDSEAAHSGDARR